MTSESSESVEKKVDLEERKTRKKKRRKRFRRFLLVIFTMFVIVYLVYFPEGQTPIAWTLATGFGVEKLQARIDGLEVKAIQNEEFSEEDLEFLEDLYTCFYKGGRLLFVLRQSSQLLQHYMTCEGGEFETSPRIFVKSRFVAKHLDGLKEYIANDYEMNGEFREVYFTGMFYMGDPQFYDSIAGLPEGRIVIRPYETESGEIMLHCRAETDYRFPSYEGQFTQYGRYDVRCFPFPNIRSALFGKEYRLWVDDGLGERLDDCGLGKPFIGYAEWDEPFDATPLMNGIR